MKYLSVTQFCEKYGFDSGNVRRYIASGRIEAVKIGNQWAIPETAQPPIDKRIKSGNYVNFRKKSNKKQAEE